jgi:hypothetical protein
MFAAIEMPVTTHAAAVKSQNEISCHHHSKSIGENVVPKGIMDVKPMNIDKTTKARMPLNIVSS